MSDRPTGVSPDPNLHLRCSRACHQTDHHLAPPWSRSLHAVSPRHHEVRSAQQGIGAGTRGRSTVGTREGTTSTVNDGSRPDTLAGAYQAHVPTGPAGNSIPGQLPPSRCSRHAIGIAAPHPSRSSSSPHRRRRSHARDRPARTQMGPGGPRSGPGTRRRPPHATTPSCCQGQHRHRAYRRRQPLGRRSASQPSITAAVDLALLDYVVPKLAAYHPRDRRRPLRHLVLSPSPEDHRSRHTVDAGSCRPRWSSPALTVSTRNTLSRRICSQRIRLD